ncbi:MAG: GDSL-type esterase/lipase family protein, partial [Verrucomicrobium sp.]
MQRLATAFLALAALISPLSAQAPPVRIMPLGDSITFGSSVPGGYRNKLYQLLTTAGYSVDFVGTQTGNGVASLPDPDHQGHGGWRIDELDTNLVGWLSQIADPDVVLVHIGTNDFGQNFSTSTAINRLDGLITKIATLRPFAHIIVTNLMERGEPANTKIQNEFNPFVQARVDAQAALGRRVTFLNMRAAVPLAEMPDNLHPGQAGYDHMADAWAPAIQAVIGVNGDDSPPQIVRMRGDVDRTHVKVTFSKPVADSAATPGNFSITGGLLVSAAQLDASKRVITLTTSQHAPGATYTVTVNGVSDRLTPTPLELPADSTGTFFTATPRGYANHVPESSSYTLALSMEVPNAANYKNGAVAYNVDNRNAIGPFSRVAYYLELQKPDGDLEYVWTSMDAFTSDVGKIGVPTLVSGAQIQQSVSGLTVVSNVPGVATGSGMTGNLEFWPTNYQGANSANVPGASPTFYDFGDNPTTGNYGSMQVHNTTDKKTVFAFNNCGGNTTPGDVDIGIGNDPAPVTNGVDWTFHHNAAQYTVKTLQVLVQTTGDTTAPTLASASATFGRTQVSVTFSEPLSPASVDAANFSLNGGVTVVGAVLSSNQREVVLATSTQPLATPLTLTVNNVRDSSAGANKIAPNSTIAVTEAALPPEIVTNVGADASGYHLVASINLPLTGNFNASNAAYLVDDRAAAGTFQRVAYYLELEKAGSPTQYVWVAMDPFTQNRNRIAIPTVASGAVYQMNINNMDVKSNVVGVVTGTGLTGGNIEFWPSDYAVANAVPVPNASATVFDAGDTRTTSGGNNFGSMQIHNHDVGANQTLLAINHFGADGNILDIGIGNNPTPVNGGMDWTYAANAPTYSRRILHVLVLPGATTLPVDVLTRVPEASSYQHVYTLNIPATGNLVSGLGFAPYSVDNKADIGPFSRVAYYMELQKSTDANPTFVWTSMDAFTNNVGRIGIPTQASGSFFQQKVTNLNVVSNSAGVTQGSSISTGNMEFWPSSYNATNAIGIPGADAAKYDWGDGNANGTSSSYGSMQVHNHGAGQVLFAINNWGAANNDAKLLCLGIGNNTASPNNLDWTFADNGPGYTKRLLHVFVLPGGNTDAVGPTLARVVPSTTLNRLMVVFNEALAEGSVVPANFVIPGLTVTSAKLLADQRSVALTTTPQTGGQAYTVNVSG